MQPAGKGEEPATAKATIASTSRPQSPPDHRTVNMEGKAFLTEEAAYKNLQQYYNSNGSKLNILQMFQQDEDRFKKYRWEKLNLTGGGSQTADRSFMFLLISPCIPCTNW